MGNVVLAVINDSELESQCVVEFLVDMGTTRASIPEETDEALDIEPIGNVPLELPNGDIQEYSYGLCKFEYEGKLVDGTLSLDRRELNR